MIKNAKLVEQFEKNYQKNNTSDFFHNLDIFEALYEEARLLSIFPLKDPMEGLEEKILLAKVLNVSGTA